MNGSRPLVARALNVNAAWVPIASMANVGGIATAPAVTAAYKKQWMPHAILLAILSMATGTFSGLLTANTLTDGWWGDYEPVDIRTGKGQERPSTHGVIRTTRIWCCGAA